MSFKIIDSLKSKELLPGFEVRFVHTDRMTFAYWDIKAGSVLPEHSHEHEQVANISEGEFALTIDGKTQTLVPGQIAVIPSNVLHSGVAITNCKMMDVFCPVREDYLGTSD